MSDNWSDYASGLRIACADATFSDTFVMLFRPARQDCRVDVPKDIARQPREKDAFTGEIAAITASRAVRAMRPARGTGVAPGTSNVRSPFVQETSSCADADRSS